MKLPPDNYGDNFPVAEGFAWNPRIPWRHARISPSQKTSWVRWLGWWTVVMMLMGILMILAAHDAFSEEIPFPGWQPTQAGELVVRFKEGAMLYPEGATRALVNRVKFHSSSLRALSTRYGLIAVEKVKKPDQPTVRLYRLRFASEAGLEKALLAYRKDPGVLSAEVVEHRLLPSARPSTLHLYTRDA